MKKMFKRTTAIAASALMLTQMLPYNVFAEPATVPGPNNNSLIIHPYLLTDSNYDTAKKADYDPTGTLADRTTAENYGSDTEANILFDVVQVDVNGQPLDGGYSSPASGKEFEHLANGYYKVTPNSASANQNHTDPNFIDAQAFFVQLPSGATGSNNYAVHVYPKLTDNNDNGDNTDPETLTDPQDPNSNDKHSIKLTKTLSDENDQFGTGGGKVGEAVFDIWYKDALGNWENAAPDEGYSTTNGILKVDGLPFGTYYAVERTAPNHYLLNQEPVVFNLTGGEGADQTGELNNDKELKVKKEIVTVGNDTGLIYQWKITADVPEEIENLLSYSVTDTYTNLKNVTIDSVMVGSKALTFAADGSADYHTTTEGNSITVVIDDLTELTGESVVINVSSVIADGYTDGQVTNESSLAYQYAYNPDDHDNDDPDGPDVIPDVIPDPDNNVPETINYPGNGSDPNTTDGFTPATIYISNYETGTTTELEVGSYNVTRCSPYSDATYSEDFVTLENLAPGEYTITQLTTASGYLIDSTPKYIYIAKNGTVYEGTEANHSETPLANNRVIFYNNKTATGFELPFTGSTATIVFTIAGIGVMGGALFFFIFFKKRDKDEEDQENA